MKNLFISHSIFLTTPEREALFKEPKTIETVGFSVPTGENDDVKLTEVFCRYLVTTEVVGDEVELMSDGYKIYIPDSSKWIKITQTPEDQVWHQYVVDVMMTVDGESYLTTHQMVMQDVADLERSTLCENLANYLNKM